MTHQTMQPRQTTAPALPPSAARAAARAGPQHSRLMQMAAMLNAAPAMQRVAAMAPVQRAPNRTGLPDQLKSGIEALSGVSMDPVRVHYNSPQPAQLNAHAFAQGTNIHLAPGQQQHLPHEAWHVVQQAQGRVRATIQLKAGVPVNDDRGLEHEADVMGARASRTPAAVQFLRLPTAAMSISNTVLQGNWLTRLFGFGKKAAPALHKPIEKGIKVFRADERPPSQIEKEGFMPRVIRMPPEAVTNEDVTAYQQNSANNPGIVSTAETEHGAHTFAHQLGTVKPGPKHIYEIAAAGLAEIPKKGNIPWYQRLLYAEQQEKMIHGGISPDRIKHVGTVDTDGSGPPEDIGK